MRDVRAVAVVLALVAAWPGVGAFGEEGPDAEAGAPSRVEQWTLERLEKTKKLEPYDPGTVEESMLFVQENKVLERLAAGFKGFHPVLGGLSTGSGFALGALYSPIPPRAPFHFSLRAVGTFKAYGAFNAAFGYERAHWLAYGYSRYQNFPQEDYFGLGDGSSEQDRTDYRMEDGLVGGLVGIKPSPAFVLAGSYSFVHNNVGSGTDGKYPSTEAVFTDENTPGLDDQVDYDRYAFTAEFDTRRVFFARDYGARYAPTYKYLSQRSVNPRQGTYARLNAALYRDRALGSYDFRRWEVEVQQYIPFNHGHRVVALRHFSTFSDPEDGARVPFYMMKTLGGGNTLRGFREFRFRDENFLVYNLEYRWEAWIGLDMAVFYDAGKVFSDPGDWDLEDLETSYGVGFRFNTFRSVLFRVDVGHGSEGTRVFMKFGHVF